MTKIMYGNSLEQALNSPRNVNFTAKWNIKKSHVIVLRLKEYKKRS